MLEFLITYYLKIIVIDIFAFFAIIWVSAIIGGLSKSQRLERTTLVGYQIGASIHGAINLVLFFLALYFTIDAGMVWYDILLYSCVFFVFVVIDAIVYVFFKKEIEQLMNLLPNIY